MSTKFIAFSLLSLLSVLPQPSSAGRVLGFRGAVEGACVAVRGFVPQGTWITGIEFWANDATVFPEVSLALDGGQEASPAPGVVLRQSERVQGRSGTVKLHFEEYVVPESQYLWAIVRFPSDQPIRSAGAGGGPGIGTRDDPTLFNQRSLYFSVSDALGELESEHFDIALLTAGAVPAPATKMSRETIAPAPAVRISMGRSQDPVTFVLDLPAPQRAVLNIYTVAGRFVGTMEENVVSAGQHVLLWPGRDRDGRRVASGIYLYEITLGQERLAGKFVVLR